MEEFEICSDFALSTFFNNFDTADVVFEDREHPEDKVFVHSALLAPHSNYFSKFCVEKASTSENLQVLRSVQIPLIAFKYVKTVLQFLYGIKISVSQSNYSDLLRVAQFLEVPDLLKFLYHIFTRMLTFRSFSALIPLYGASSNVLDEQFSRFILPQYFYLLKHDLLTTLIQSQHSFLLSRIIQNPQLLLSNFFPPFMRHSNLFLSLNDEETLFSFHSPQLSDCIPSVKRFIHSNLENYKSIIENQGSVTLNTSCQLLPPSNSSITFSNRPPLYANPWSLACLIPSPLPPPSFLEQIIAPHPKEALVSKLHENRLRVVALSAYIPFTNSDVCIGFCSPHFGDGQHPLFHPLFSENSISISLQTGKLFYSGIEHAVLQCSEKQHQLAFSKKKTRTVFLALESITSSCSASSVFTMCWVNLTACPNDWRFMGVIENVAPSNLLVDPNEKRDFLKDLESEVFPFLTLTHIHPQCLPNAVSHRFNLYSSSPRVSGDREMQVEPGYNAQGFGAAHSHLPYHHKQSMSAPSFPREDNASSAEIPNSGGAGRQPVASAAPSRTTTVILESSQYLKPSASILNIGFVDEFLDENDFEVNYARALGVVEERDHRCDFLNQGSQNMVPRSPSNINSDDRNDRNEEFNDFSSTSEHQHLMERISLDSHDGPVTRTELNQTGASPPSQVEGNATQMERGPIDCQTMRVLTQKRLQLMQQQLFNEEENSKMPSLFNIVRGLKRTIDVLKVHNHVAFEMENNPSLLHHKAKYALKNTCVFSADSFDFYKMFFSIFSNEKEIFSPQSSQQSVASRVLNILPNKINSPVNNNTVLPPTVAPPRSENIPISALIQQNRSRPPIQYHPHLSLKDDLSTSLKEDE